MNQGSHFNEAGLIAPGIGEYVHASWDDHGEEKPRDQKGPNLVVSLSIPKGSWYLSFYFSWGQKKTSIRNKGSERQCY
jgi:hypothetical protein